MNPTAKTQSELTILPDQLERILAEVRRESPEVEAEKEQTRIKRQRTKELLGAALIKAEKARNEVQNACDHMKRNLYGQEVGSAIHGQIHSDRKFHPLCVRCFKEFDPIPGHKVPNAGGRSSGGSFDSIGEAS